MARTPTIYDRSRACTTMNFPVLLPFLSLLDVLQLVQCNRRFCYVARKAPGLCLHVQGDAAMVPRLVSSMLDRHVTSVGLRHSNAGVTRDTLRLLRQLPRLTKLQLKLGSGFSKRAAPLLQGQSEVDIVAEALRAVLPTHLLSFNVDFGWSDGRTLGSALYAAVPVMPQLTELSLMNTASSLKLFPGVLVQLPCLRKLCLGFVEWTPELLSELKQCRGLRELHILDFWSEQLVALCKPPHSLQLDSIEFPLMVIGEAEMHALLHLPTLTALVTGQHKSNVWPLLPQLLLLQRLAFWPSELLTAEMTSALSASLSQCKALTELSGFCRVRCGRHSGSDSCALDGHSAQSRERSPLQCHAR
jgi:hypothetical protein